MKCLFSAYLLLYFRFIVALADGFFTIRNSKPSGWTHIVLNYIGPNYGEGTRIYYNGQEVDSDRAKGGTSYAMVDGRIVVGRRFTNVDEDYASITIDELIFFNRFLKVDEIETLATTT